MSVLMAVYSGDTAGWLNYGRAPRQDGLAGLGICRPTHICSPGHSKPGRLTAGPGKSL